MTRMLVRGALMTVVAAGVALAELPAQAGTWIGDDGTVVYGAPPPPVGYGAAVAPAPAAVPYAPPMVGWTPPPAAYEVVPPVEAYGYGPAPVPYGGPALEVSVGP